MVVIKNKNIRGCRICQNKLISDVVDQILYNAEMTDKEVRDKLHGQYGFMVELTEIKAHSRHIFTNDIDYKKLEGDELLRIETIKTIDLIKEEIARLNIQELQMIDEGKVEGEISDMNFTVPDWISKLEENNDNKKQQ